MTFVLINKIYISSIRELIIDKNQISPQYEYIFSETGEHYVKFVLNLLKINNTEFMFSDIYNLISINISNKISYSNIKSIYGMFKNCVNLEYVNFSNSFSNIENCSFSFQNCKSLIFLDISNIITYKTLNISYMFANCSSLQSIDLSKFDTINIKDMNGLFYHCSSLTSINFKTFKTSNVLTMKHMFEGCSSLTNIDINSLQLSNVKDMSYMFKNCIKLTSMEFPNFEGHKQIIKKGVFDGCNSLKKKYDICIVGYWFGTNYGSLATYYALHQAVKNMGYSVLMIDNPLTPLRESNYDKCHPITIGRALYDISEQKPLDKLI